MNPLLKIDETALRLSDPSIPWHQRLSHLLTSTNTDRATLCAAIGISPTTLSQWLTGQAAAPNGENLLRAADFFQIDPFWIMRGTLPTSDITKDLSARIAAQIAKTLARRDAPIAAASIEIVLKAALSLPGTENCRELFSTLDKALTIHEHRETPQGKMAMQTLSSHAELLSNKDNM